MIRKKPFSFTSACEVKFKRASVIFLSTIVVSVISSYQSCLALDHQIFIFKWRFKFDFKSSFRFNLELLTDTAARLLVFLCRDLIFGGELNLPTVTWAFAAPVNPYRNVGAVVLSLQRLSCFPQLWPALSSSSHKSWRGLNRTFSAVI